MQLVSGETESATRDWLKNGGIPSREIVAVDSREIDSGTGIGTIITRGTLEGAGQWTHPYADIGRTSSSEDTLVKLPLGMLWWGGPGRAPRNRVGMGVFLCDFKT